MDHLSRWQIHIQKQIQRARLKEESQHVCQSKSLTIVGLWGMQTDTRKSWGRELLQILRKKDLDKVFETSKKQMFERDGVRYNFNHSHLVGCEDLCGLGMTTIIERWVNMNTGRYVKGPSKDKNRKKCKTLLPCTVVLGAETDEKQLDELFFYLPLQCIGIGMVLTIYPSTIIVWCPGEFLK